MGAALGGFALFVFHTVAQDSAHKTVEPWQIIQLPQSSLVFARDGTPIGEIGHEMRTSVPLKFLPAYVPQAFIAIEDQRFYEHDGVDVIGVLGAIKGKILRENRGGASTITLDGSASATDNFYQNEVIFIRSGAGASSTV